MLPFMVEHNWLVAYASIEGISKVLSGMNRRTKGISKMDKAVDDLKEHHALLEKDFREFFKDLELYTNKKQIELQKQ